MVDDFGVKYSSKEHALHLKASLETKYKVTTDWEGKLHIGIALKWDYEKRNGPTFNTRLCTHSTTCFPTLET